MTANDYTHHTTTTTTTTTTCRVATAHDQVWNSECCYTFHTPYTTDQGILVSLQHWVAITADPVSLSLSSSLQPYEPGMYVRIVKKRVERTNAGDGSVATASTTATTTTTPPTVLGVGIPGGFASENERFEIQTRLSVVVMDENGVIAQEQEYREETKHEVFPDSVIRSVDSVVNHVGTATQRDVEAWQLDQEEIAISKYALSLPFVENGVTISPNPGDWKCQKSGDTDNLWLNLSTGYIGGGRKHWDGTGGSNGALDHFIETGKLYPLVVKLGTITADLSTADCYSYADDEDGPVKVPNLKELLEKRGIHVAAMQKTVKSTAELEVELNATYAFDAITEAGAELKPVTGPGYQGLQNLGNSCYMNSALEVLFSTPELARRYGTPPEQPLMNHTIFQGVSMTAAPSNLLVQTAKVASALTSGVFCRPLDADETDPKYRLAPRLFKHCIGKDHVDFRTTQQQDAAQFWQYLLQQLDRAERGAAVHPVLGTHFVPPPTTELHVASQLFAFAYQYRWVCQADQRIKYKTSAPETIWSVRIPMEKAIITCRDGGDEDATKKLRDAPEQKRLKSDEIDADQVPTISLQTCIDDWGAETNVADMRWPHLNNAVAPATEQMRFSNFPRYLVLQLQRYKLGPDWQPIKLQVNVTVPEELDLTAWRATGPVNGENIIGEEPDESKEKVKETVVDEMALAQLMDMGFSLNSSTRALSAVGGSDLEAAMGWVFEHNNDPDFNDPPPSAGDDAPSLTSNVDEGLVESLVSSLGCFTSHQVRAALQQANGAPDRAADWLFSHMDDLDAAVASVFQIDNAKTSSVPPPASCLYEDGEGKYNLFAMISHIGKHTGSGHYVAHIKKDGKWVIFNDEKVALSSEPPFPHAYMYIFQRADTVGSPNPSY